MTTLYCAICGAAVEPDTNHYWVDAELRRIDDRNEQAAYALHTACWERLTDGWSQHEPATRRHGLEGADVSGLRAHHEDRPRDVRAVWPSPVGRRRGQ